MYLLPTLLQSIVSIFMRVYGSDTFNDAPSGLVKKVEYQCFIL